MGAAVNDAVIVLPGIMGSELVEVSSGRTLWGLADAGWYARAWTTGDSLGGLAVTDDERAGRVGRVRATRLLRAPAWAPVLRGFEPYTALVAAVRQAAADPTAVLEFPYDWRLSVEYNAGRLAIAAYEHLRRWRTHPLAGPDARLVLVAHSTGGLVARYFTEVLGGAGELRALVTLGTPFFGSVKAVDLLGGDSGTSLSLPHRRLRRLAGSLPGLHDLLPSYDCVDEGTSVRRLTAGDIAGLGGDGQLAGDAFARRERLMGEDGSWATLWPLIGVEQPTAQSLVLRDGVADPRFVTCRVDRAGCVERVDRRGDETVYREAAFPAAAKPFAFVQTHGALPITREAIAHVCAVLGHEELGPEPSGAVTPLALEMPDSVPAGTSLDIAVEGVPDPAAVDVRVVDVTTGATLPRARPVRREGRLMIRQILPMEGLFRVVARVGAQSPVTQLVLATDPSAEPDESEHA
ncbi:lipase/acyltransferase domain-containing protein [Embleya sp. NBC_00896]|uniref:lipase/acyltransferase domain-containing protein n=1 Tax=Embleya sp. NBC_00896 TaxID=2975961 RepID=UPI002F91472E|nr:hypothetical protein OG928_39810 [Embleya sp. NBC_00896]